MSTDNTPKPLGDPAVTARFVHLLTTHTERIFAVVCALAAAHAQRLADAYILEGMTPDDAYREASGPGLDWLDAALTKAEDQLAAAIGDVPPAARRRTDD